jgi:hypothetical protein
MIPNPTIGYSPTVHHGARYHPMPASAPLSHPAPHQQYIAYGTAPPNYGYDAGQTMQPFPHGASSPAARDADARLMHGRVSASDGRAFGGPVERRTSLGQGPKDGGMGVGKADPASLDLLGDMEPTPIDEIGHNSAEDFSDLAGMFQDDLESVSKPTVRATLVRGLPVCTSL